MEFISSHKWVKPFMVVYSLVAIPNLIALFLLSGTVVKLVKEYYRKEK